MMNGARANSFMRDSSGVSPTVLSIHVWGDGSARAKVDGIELNSFIKAVRETPHGVTRIVKMLREAASLIEAGIV